MSKHLMNSVIIIFQILILTACNLPAGSSPTKENAPPDIVFTSAAETTEAQLSPTIIPVTQKPTSTVMPIEDEPIHSPEPTLTATPTEFTYSLRDSGNYLF